ncbi:MAG: ribosomal protein S18-alanine N-acetyltransferase [Acidobacteria bacterium]|nr:ribosomal protein S18-alanine N-acetyltransferase [Acidobacteriota bacterium]
MSVALEIRAARVEDIASVMVLERAVEGAPHWSEQEYAAMLTPCEGVVVRRRLIVADRDSTLIGFAVAKVIGDVGELESVAVAAGERRNGVGLALCEAAIEWCRGQQVEAVELEVRSKNEAAAALYKELGFTDAGVRKAYYRDPVDDAVLMTKVCR